MPQRKSRGAVRDVREDGVPGGGELPDVRQRHGRASQLGTDAASQAVLTQAAAGRLSRIAAHTGVSGCELRETKNSYQQAKCELSKGARWLHQAVKPGSDRLAGNILVFRALSPTIQRRSDRNCGATLTGETGVVHTRFPSNSRNDRHCSGADGLAPLVECAFYSCTAPMHPGANQIIFAK